jgi:hypothetical protein
MPCPLVVALQLRIHTQLSVCLWPVLAAVQLPAWPFVCASVFLGAYALIPYMALWEPKSPQQQLPPPEDELVSREPQ